MLTKYFALAKWQIVIAATKAKISFAAIFERLLKTFKFTEE
jgi:hypothetical protein